MLWWETAREGRKWGQVPPGPWPLIFVSPAANFLSSHPRPGFWLQLTAVPAQHSRRGSSGFWRNNMLEVHCPACSTLEDVVFSRQQKAGLDSRSTSDTKQVAKITELNSGRMTVWTACSGLLGILRRVGSCVLDVRVGVGRCTCCGTCLCTQLRLVGGKIEPWCCT